MERLARYLGKNWFCAGLILLLTLLVWGQTIGYGFVWDDEILVLRNQSIRSFRNIPAIFSRLDAQSEEAAPSFRPIRTTFYAVLYALDGQEVPRPWIFHLSNILWHAAAGILLFWVALALLDRLYGGLTTAMRVTALLVALGFAVNPTNSETVCWIKCLDDLMAGVFVLASALTLLRWNGTNQGLVAPLLWFLLAAFAKESAAPFAVVAFLIFYGFHKIPWQRSARLTIPFLAVAFVYVVVRQMVIGRASQCAPLSGTYGQTLIDMFPVIPQYLRLLCGIGPFCVDYNYLVAEPPYPVLSLGVMGGFGLLALWAGLTFALWFRLHWRLVAFGLAWLGFFLLPVSNLIPMMQYMAERFLYLPMMGFLLALGGVLLNFPQPRRIVATALGILGIWISTSFDRMTIWQDGLTMFVRTEFEHPGIRRVQQNAVSAIYSLPQMEPLFPDYRKTGSVRMADSLTPAQAEAMIAVFEQARKLFPTNALLTTDLAFVDAKIGRWPDAIALAEQAVRQKPDSAQYWLNLASMYRATGKIPQARDACAQSLKINPDFKDAQILKAKLETNPK